MANDTTAYMPLWVGDYLADTQHLTTTEHGIYLLLIMHYWRNGPIPTDKRKCMRISGVTRYSSCATILEEFFTETSGKWHHKRIDKELQKIKDYQSRRSDAGKAGAAARWNGKRIANASDGHSARNGTHTHTHNNKYIFVGDVFRLTTKTLGDFTKMGAAEADILAETKKADEYYHARIQDGHESEDFRYSSTAFFKLSNWLGNHFKKGSVAQGNKKPRIVSAI